MGYLRRRWYRLTTPAGAVIPSAAVGSADLTFTMKMVDASRGVAPLALPEAAAGAALTAKVENDVHCERGCLGAVMVFRVCVVGDDAAGRWWLAGRRRTRA